MNLENHLLDVHFDEKTLGLTGILDKRTGKTWRPARTAFVVNVWDSMSQRNCPRAAGFDPAATMRRVRSDDQQLTVDYHQEELGISLRLIYTLRDDCLEVDLPIESLKESKPDQFHLRSVELFPQFGGIPRGEQGYAVLPQYGGILHHFDREAPPDAEALAADPQTEFAVSALFGSDPAGPREHGSMMYGHQGHWEDMVALPLFGAVHQNSGYLAVVTSGEFDTEIRVKIDQGPERLNSVAPIFHFRNDEIDDIDPVDRTVRYHFLAHERANYAAMADVYRQHLLNEKGCLPIRERLRENRLLDYVRDCYYLKIYFGRKPTSPTGDAELQTYLTYREARELLGAWKRAGVIKANIDLTGWNREGHDGLYPTLFPIETTFGTEQEFQDLIEEAKKLGYRITVHINYRDTYRRSPDWDPAYVLKDSHGRLVKQGMYGGGTVYPSCPVPVLERFLKRDLPRLKQMGMDGMLYFDGILGMAQPCYDPSHPLSRRQYVQAVKEHLEYAAKLFGAVHTEVAQADLIGTVDHVMHLPAYKWAKPNWIKHAAFYQKGIAHEGIPLQAMVYHGLMLYCLSGSLAEEPLGALAVLPSVEYGALPRDTWYNNRPADRIAGERRQYEILCERLGHLQLEFMVANRQLDAQVFETVYANGQRTIVNYAEHACDVEGRTIPAKDFLLL